MLGFCLKGVCVCVSQHIAHVGGIFGCLLEISGWLYCFLVYTANLLVCFSGCLLFFCFLVCFSGIFQHFLADCHHAAPAALGHLSHAHRSATLDKHQRQMMRVRSTDGCGSKPKVPFWGWESHPKVVFFGGLKWVVTRVPGF